MPPVPDIVPVTDLRRDAAAALERVRGSGQPLVTVRLMQAASAAVFGLPPAASRVEKARITGLRREATRAGTYRAPGRTHPVTGGGAADGKLR